MSLHQRWKGAHQRAGSFVLNYYAVIKTDCSGVFEEKSDLFVQKQWQGYSSPEVPREKSDSWQAKAAEDGFDWQLSLELCLLLFSGSEGRASTVWHLDLYATYLVNSPPQQLDRQGTDVQVTLSPPQFLSQAAHFPSCNWLRFTKEMCDKIRNKLRFWTDTLNKHRFFF